MSFAGIKEKQAKKRAKRTKKQNLTRSLGFTKAKPTFIEEKGELRRVEDKDQRSSLQMKALGSPRRSMPSSRQRKPSLIADTCLRLSDRGRVGTKMTSFLAPFWSFSNTINATLVIF